ncbi:MAG: cytochrome c oxidase assembly protein [Rhodospirillales bacterium]|nr:cytochrome c oxidase assembly protein [Rhodospirillales bacterium]
MMPLRRKLTVLALLAVIGVMTTLVSYSVTLYRLFCEVTGANGTTQRVASDDATVSARKVTVFFDTNVAPGMPWRFIPLQRKIVTHLGEQTPVFFEAQNISDRPIVGHATFNVTPSKAGIYFKKIECFCFTEERLDPHQTVQMPVVFFVDPKIATDPDARDVDQITLSYTFFPSARPKGAEDLSRFTTGPANPELGGRLFAQNCSACHELDRAKVGPPLASVIGRTAGTVPGYPYSPALARSGIVWTPVTLEKWLAGPQADVPGALMPMAIANPVERRDIIAYLQSLPRTSSAAAPEAKPPG